MLSVALGDEVAAYIAAHARERDQRERQLVVRSRHVRPWHVITVAGAVEAHAPRVNDKPAAPAAGPHREPAQPWVGLLRDCKQRGMRGPPPYGAGADP